MTYLGLDSGRLLAVVDGLNRIAAGLPELDAVAETGAAVAMTLTDATGATVNVLDPGRVRTFTMGDATSAGSELTLPLEIRGQQMGAIALVKRSSEGFDEAAVEAARLFAEGLSAQLENAARFEVAITESRVDPLTGLGNRLAFDERLGWELSRSTRYSEKLSLGLFAIDDFAGLQARLGPDDLDRLVVEVAEVLSEGRSADSCYRVAADVFAIVMPNTPEHGAEIAAIRMAWKVALLRGGGIATLTTGVAEPDVPDARALMAAAEDSLRVARSRVDA